jgi:hypothetical protein
LITQHAAAEAAAGDWAGVAEILNAPTVAVRNEKAWTMADLIALVGDQQAALVGGTIRSAGASNPIFEGAWFALNVVGLQLHTDEWQSMIDGLASAGNWSPELTAAVKAAGVTYSSLAVDPVTEDDCRKAMAVAGCRADLQKLTAKATAANAWLDTLDLSQSVAAVEAYCADLLASADGNPTGGG